MKVEVKGNQSQEVDWTKNPQLVVSKKGRVVKVLKMQTPARGDCFSGFCLNDDECSSMSVNTWLKSEFKPFHGEITLKND